MEKCRTCLTETTNFKQLFLEENLPIKLKILTSLDISEEKNLPQYPKTICELCLNNINNFYKFRNKVMDCNWILKSTTEKQLNKKTREESHIKLVEIYEENDHICKIEEDWENNLQLDEENLPEEKNFIKEKEEIDSDVINKICEKPISNTTTISNTAADNKTTAVNETENKNKIAVNSLKIPCKICGILKTRKLMNNHLSSHNETNIKSSLRKRKSVFVLKVKQTCNKLKLEKQNSYQCSYCDFTTETVNILTEHRKEHADLRFPDVKKVKGDKVRTENGVLYECPICGKRFQGSHSFYGHKLRMHLPITDLKVNCKVCGKLVVKAHIKKHMLLHEKDTARTCEICGKVSTSVRGILKHLNMHKKIDSVCEICGKHIEYQTTYIGHMNTHKKKAAMALKCKFCDKRFWNKDVHHRHENSHTGYRPYPCEICDKRFSSKFSLKGHMRQHTNEHPFVCTECPKGFLHRVSMKNHMKRAHGIDLFNKTDEEEASDKTNE